MATKAILITNDNVEQLTTKYTGEACSGVPLAVGYYMVMGFGDHFGYELLSSANFNTVYSIGQPIRNGFFEAVRK